MDTNLYWVLRGTYSERKAKLASVDRAWLEASILDEKYNEFLCSKADYKDHEKDAHGHGKRVPYIGWFWRRVTFSAGTISLGDCGEFVGFMENNKWGYRERSTTAEEFVRIMTIIDEAMKLDEQGGSLDKIIESTNAKLEELWGYMQTLTIPA